jgi:hypothetical protein
MITKSQTVAGDIVALLRARNPLLWIVSREEGRVERYVFEAAAAAGYVARTWDVAQGIAKMDGVSVDSDTQDPAAALAYVRTRATAQYGGGDRGVYIMRDLPVWLQGQGGAATLRAVRNLARLLPSIERARAQALVIISPDGTVPPELSGHATVIEWPLPDREEVASILDAAIGGLPTEMQEQAAPNGSRDAAIDAAIGLSGEEAAACYAKSLVQLKRIDAAAVAKEKKRVITREKVLEWYDPIPGGLDAVGGLENLKAWLVARKAAYSPAARAYGLPAPKGALLVGVPGCGKSLTAKAIATAYGVPLLRLDLNALKSKFVGDSEANIRRAFRTIEAIGRCVVWIDEVEKALAGATQGGADGGVSTDALGSILSWMQERQGEAFVIATANEVESLPPELLRKGRFDEIWFVDLPTPNERVAILTATLRAHGRSPDNWRAGDYQKVVEACEGFTGAEIAALVPDAMFEAFADGARDITTRDMLAAAKTVSPLSETAKEKIVKLRAWAKGRARAATASGTKDDRATIAARQIDI